MNSTVAPVQFAGGCLGRERHICAFFNSADEEYRSLLPFIKEGFERGERAVHIVDETLKDDHIGRLRAAGIDADSATAAGQLEIRRWEEAYLRRDRFDQDAMLALIEQVLQTGSERGFPLTRLVAHMEWATLDRPGVEDLAEYETRLNYILPKYDDPVICTYDLARFSSRVAFDILRTHPVVIVGGVLQENPFFVPPDKFLLELRERKHSRRAERVN
jgi:DcmR-like sensory protein